MRDLDKSYRNKLMKYTKPTIRVIELECESFIASSSGGVNVDQNTGTVSLDPTGAETSSDEPIEGDARINGNYWDKISRSH
jgi:hypothetical protein